MAYTEKSQGMKITAAGPVITQNMTHHIFLNRFTHNWLHWLLFLDSSFMSLISFFTLHSTVVFREFALHIYMLKLYRPLSLICEFGVIS